MSEHLHEPDEQGNVVDQTEADLTSGPGRGGETVADAIGAETPPASASGTGGDRRPGDQPPDAPA